MPIATINIVLIVSVIFCVPFIWTAIQTMSFLDSRVKNVEHFVMRYKPTLPSFSKWSDGLQSRLHERLPGMWDDMENRKLLNAESDSDTFDRSMATVDNDNEYEFESMGSRINDAAAKIAPIIEDAVAESLADSAFIKRMFGSKFAGDPALSIVRQNETPSRCIATKDPAGMIVKLATKISIDEMEEYAALANTRIEAKVDSKTSAETITYCDCMFLECGDKRAQRTQQKFRLMRIMFISNAGDPIYTCYYSVSNYGTHK